MLCCRTSLKIGSTNLTKRQVEMLIIEMGTHYSGKNYNIISKNCNHFGDEFCKKLCNGTGIPGWINRLAFFGNFNRKFQHEYLTFW
jgi:deubiquitinase DESI2